MSNSLVISEKDNVATALKDLEKNVVIDVEVGRGVKKVELEQGVLFGHKFAIKRIKKGEEIIKYGEKIGKATEDIGVGQHVHIHNVESMRGRGDSE